MRFDPVPNDRESEREKFLATFDRDGNDPVLFGPKPMHFFWYDDETVMGHDHRTPDGKPNNRKVRRWTRTGDFVETLAGPGNHLGASDDRSSYASDTWYYEAPVELRVYARGGMVPAQHVFASTHTDVVWQRGAHVNPSFSRDGSRLYFTNPSCAL